MALNYFALPTDVSILKDRKAPSFELQMATKVKQEP